MHVLLISMLDLTTAARTARARSSIIFYTSAFHKFWPFVTRTAVSACVCACALGHSCSAHAATLQLTWRHVGKGNPLVLGLAVPGT